MEAITMLHIEAELDPIHAERLTRLQVRLRKPLPDVLANLIDLGLAKLDQPVSITPSVWEAREHFEREQGRLTEEFDLPPREIAESTWRNPLHQ